MAVIILCICTLPIKTVTTLSYPGGRIDFDGNLMSEETTTIVATWRDYLFREDTMDPEITFSSLNARMFCGSAEGGPTPAEILAITGVTA